MSLSLPEFVERWKASTLTERAAAQSHFIDLCDVLGHPHPAAADHTGDSFTFEKHVSTNDDGKGFADVWKRGYFGWEYKGKHRDLNAAYRQLLRYREDLESPPLLVTCDLERFEVHTNFTGSKPQVFAFTLDDLTTGKPTANSALPPIDVLRAVFNEPDLLRPEASRARVTEAVAAEFGKLAESLNNRGVPPQSSAHFLMRLLFCLFADSIGLLPDHLFRRMIELDKSKPANFTRKLRHLFAAMSNEGSVFGAHDIHFFNGGLFMDDEVFALDWRDMAFLQIAAQLDWSQVEPAIFGTLFERSLDPSKRSQLGAHYTSAEDISLVVEPVVMVPLESRWAEVKAQALAITADADKLTGRAHTNRRTDLRECLLDWLAELASVRVLDPACGSGNFLYLALRRMLDLWHETRSFAAEHDLPTFVPKQVHPSQLFGLETNVYAQELASVVVWIGYLQWLHEHGMGVPQEPILSKLNNIQHRDAILELNAKGDAVESEWPNADFIIGNPPFLGGKRLRNELGDEYVETLFAVYRDRVPPEADLVTYWFEKARAMIESKRARRAGLLATQAIRGGANRKVLERIKACGDIFMAYSDRNWVLDGATVHVSIIGFDGGIQKERTLDGVDVAVIHANLTSEANVTIARRLPENANLCFMGTTKIGAFDLTPQAAAVMLAAPLNPNGKPNSEVVKPWVNALDLTRRSRGMFIIDFGTDMTQEEAALYEMPFQYLLQNVHNVRQHNNREAYRVRWWIHGEPRPELRTALSKVKRFIVTPGVAKHRLFVWLSMGVVPDHALFAFARDDDYFFGVLHPRVHEVWARAQGTQLREVESGFRYTPSSTFETFPLPWPPQKEPKRSPVVNAIAIAARDLVEKRDAWLNPPDASPEELALRTLTNLYNAYPAWLADAHRKLDEAVFAAYGWPVTLTDDQLLKQLLDLNHQRAPVPTPEVELE